MKFLAIPQNSVMIRVIESSVEKTRTSWDAVDQSWIREENVSCLSFNGMCDMWQNSVVHFKSVDDAFLSKGMILYSEDSFPQPAMTYYDSSD
jgi:hypothetical protein